MFNSEVSPLLLFYLMGATFLLIVAIIVYPTLRDQSKKKRL
ncbi:MAG: hypothetical protein UY08_C0002G0021 [Candidatus Gottesmanbacteria bacterium GW2011_GWA1_47_8]|uniref:Uncharacterized protein n=1 Tax=Candidatus Gottesmanbacteria bacterium GW2011_GWA1_47_8 TaxID=1618438 RepID=A0A0G1VSK0_9BACT|nr:MAG: hypothetical protein UY08_C0002G0021 [Candidatus Gottesmanbacteria bacterium GW2011_GWA1_47_8]